MEILLTLAFFAPFVWLLERTHRRTRDLPRIPFGADAESLAAGEYRRQIAELRSMRQLMAEPDASPPPPLVTPPVTAVRPAPTATVLQRLERTLGVSHTPLGGWAGSATTMKPC